MNQAPLINQMIQQRPELSQIAPGSPGASPATAVQAPLPQPSSALPPHPVMNQPPPLPQHPVMNPPPQGMAPQAQKLPMTQENIIVQALIKQLERLDTNKKMPGIQLPPGLS